VHAAAHAKQLARELERRRLRRPPVPAERSRATGDRDVVTMNCVDRRSDGVDHRAVDLRGNEPPARDLRAEKQEQVRLVPDLPVPDTRKTLKGSAVPASSGGRKLRELAGVRLPQVPGGPPRTLTPLRSIEQHYDRL
jgi:hypothetical protein